MCVYVRLCVCACVRVYESICVFVGMCVSGICVAVSVLPVFFCFPVSLALDLSLCVCWQVCMYMKRESVLVCV